MKRNKIIAIFLAGCFGMTFANAQEVLTLQQALKYALQNKAEAKKAVLEVENAQYQIAEVRGTALPQITANGSIRKNVIIPESAFDIGGQTVTAKMGRPWVGSGLFSLNQQIFNQTIFTGLKAAKTTEEFYAINKDLTEEQVIERVANAYYDVFQAKMQLQTIDNNLNSTTKTRDVIKGLVDAGLGRKIDLDRTTVAVNNLQSSRQVVVNALELSENALKFTIGMPIDEKIIMPEETFEVNASLNTEAISIDQRTEILLAEKQLHLLNLNKKSKIADLYPKLSLAADFGWSGFGDSSPFTNRFSWPQTSGIGLNLSIPIFAGGTTKARINMADIQIRQAKVDLEDTKLGLSLANNNAKTQIKNSLLTINTNRANVTLAKDVLADTENNYRNGLATLTELLDAENAYAEAQNNLTTALLNYKVAEVQLIKAKGELKTLVNEK
ncbi:TolC family protein [Sphingobacterium rhinopitheci]|uniref:TolC family protein n=1 Tax=Sphingobacterium rhinopitheci TaxID=2781960 RepID=UPI001F516FEA|nr:TolC family protein [Sphingobacterium rhinopitheci]MCI0922055.1 TolC family protein [Sphingobacterium rhinopitheci]